MSRRNNTGRNPYVEEGNATMLMGMVLSFLGLFLPKTLAKKVVCTILLVAGAPVARAVLLSGLTERCVRDIGRSVRSGKLNNVLASRQGSGRKSKTSAMEEEIIFSSLSYFTSTLKPKLRSPTSHFDIVKLRYLQQALFMRANSLPTRLPAPVSFCFWIPSDGRDCV